MRTQKTKQRKYEFRSHARVSGITAEIAGSELDRICQQNEGVLTPAAVVSEARPEEAPLHPAFEWDDSVAAEEHRKWQARQLIRAVHVVMVKHNGEDITVPRFVHVEMTEAPGYRPTDVVVEQSDLFAQAITELIEKVQMAQAAVDALQRLASTRPDLERDQLAKISLAVQALQTAGAVVQTLQ